ncbi:MAG TPA: hypothetical protein VK980_04870 [Sphingomonas sp.]|nr:hypothetical protein [Sphingomonas sp.]
MTHAAKLMMRGLISVGVGTVALLWSGDLPINGGTALVSTADARVGRPLTPVSYAGVARRTTRRAVAVGAAGVAVGAAAATSCYQVVDSYGRVSTVCR